jgi:hypothetical protein
MLGFQEYLEEKLMTFGGKAYQPFNQVVIMAGGSSSGKGFTISNLIGLESMTFDVDHLKSLSLKSLEVQKAAKDRFGVDISKFQLKNPDDVAALHDILSDKLGIIDKHQATRFKSIMMAAPDRKPNLIFDVTLKDLRKLDKISKQVQQLGYSVDNIHIVWVVNDFRVALQQNRERDRMVPEDILLDTHVGAGMTMKSLIDGTYDLKKYANGDFYISFNKRGVDSSVASSGKGGSYVKDSNYLKIKSKGKPITPLKDLSKEVVKKIAAYVPSLANWEDAAK